MSSVPPKGPNSITLGDRASPYEFGDTIQHSTNGTEGSIWEGSSDQLGRTGVTGVEKQFGESAGG